VNFKPRLRTIFLMVNLVVLLIPLGSIGVLRIYETELIRRTESELISQGALIQAMYRDRLLSALDHDCDRPPNAGPYGLPVDVKWPVNIEGKFKPVPAELDAASDQVYPVVPEAVAPKLAADECAQRVGKALLPVLLEAQQHTLSGMHVVDYRGTVVASTQSLPGKSIINRQEVRRALDGEFVKLLRRRTSAPQAWSLESIQRRTSVRVFVAMPIVHQGRILGAVALVRTPMSLLKAIYTNRIIFGAFLGVILLAAVVISLLTAVFIGRPIRRLVEQTRRITREEEDATEPIDHPGTHEIDDLSRAFADMAEALNERADYIRTFARNVSHEFKTPISSIQGTVELLEDHLETMSDEQRHKFLGMLTADAHRMERLVTRLLDLARADVLQPRADTVEIGAALAEIDARFDDIQLTVDNPRDIDQVAMAREAFDSIVSNLIENSRQHGAQSISLKIETPEFTKKDGGFVDLIIEDDGPGISKGNADKIFEEFFTTKRSEGGTGLGLSIVRSLMRAHGGDIELLESEPTENEPTENKSDQTQSDQIKQAAKFRLRFPA
jgi:signal transduction histidine kinase